MMMRDDDGQEIHAGDVVSFCYGIPPVGVQAKVADINGVLFAMTPGHKPDKCKLSELRRHVGGFYKIRRHTTMPNETVTPADVAGLVERLRGVYRIPITDGLGAVGSGDEPDNQNEFVRTFGTPPVQHEAATALEAQAAELAMWREVKHSSPRLEIIEAELTAERAAHAETRRERDEARNLFDECAIARDTAGFLGSVPDCIAALSAENERLRKALEPFAREAAEWWWKFGDDQQVSCRPGPPHDENEVAQFTVGDLRAARRALEGGE